MEAFWTFLRDVCVAIINKINIVVILLALVIFGLMNDERVFNWMNHIGKAFKGLLP